MKQKRYVDLVLTLILTLALCLLPWEAFAGEKAAASLTSMIQNTATKTWKKI